MKYCFLALLNLLFYASHSYSGVVHPHTLWHKKNIKVCWATSETRFNGLSAIEATCTPFIFDNRHGSINLSVPEREFRNAIEHIIKKQFTSRRTGIYFYGWDLCTNDDDSDVTLFFQKATTTYEAGGASSIGNCGGGPKHTPIPGKPGLFLSLYNPHDHLTPMYAIHEFGHLAGLLHEREYNDPRYLRVHRAEAARYVMPVTSYDYESIMNYDHKSLIREAYENANMAGNRGLNKDELKIELSPKDIQTLKSIYKR